MNLLIYVETSIIPAKKENTTAEPNIKHYECCIHAAMENSGIKEHE